MLFRLGLAELIALEPIDGFELQQKGSALQVLIG